MRNTALGSRRLNASRSPFWPSRKHRTSWPLVASHLYLRRRALWHRRAHCFRRALCLRRAHGLHRALCRRRALCLRHALCPRRVLCPRRAAPRPPALPSAVPPRGLRWQGQPQWLAAAASAALPVARRVSPSVGLSQARRGWLSACLSQARRAAPSVGPPRTRRSRGAAPRTPPQKERPSRLACGSHRG